jgi:hypothetical protein
MADSSVKMFPLASKGLVLGVDPRLMTEGQLQEAVNVTSLQEGSISTRSGSTFVVEVGVSLTSNIRKLRILDNDSFNLRYFGALNGASSDIVRTADFISYDLAGAAVTNTSDFMSKRWSMAAYSAGATGNPWAFFACPNKMLKDSGVSPFTPMKTWGILPAAGVALAVVAAGDSWTIAGATLTSIVVSSDVATATTSAPHGMPIGTWVEISGATVEPKLNGTYKITSLPTTSKFTFATASVADATYTDATLEASNANLLDGGATDSPPGTMPYKYRYTYKSVSTGNEGNPSQEMADVSDVVNGVPLGVHQKRITVHVWGTVDSTEFPTIVIYRAGGTVADGLYHKLATVTNTWTTGAAVDITYTDSIPDNEIVYADTLMEDNAPPIVSSLATPFSKPITAAVAATGFQTVTVVPTGITPGSQVHFMDGTPEIVTVWSVAAGSFTAYCQNTHLNGERVECYSAVGQPAGLCCTAFDSIFVAGDPNNRHALYKSKTGFPESFPIIDEAFKSHVINVGSPSNYIVNICEFNGVIVCLNVSNIFEVQVWQGAMQAPVATPANRGLHPLAPWAWCKANNELYYLAYDGIYSWSGGQSLKRSAAIDSMFQNKRVGSGSSGVYPIDFSAASLAYSTMEFANNNVYLVYRSTDGNTRMLVYETLNDRWTIQSSEAILSIHNEEDVGKLLVAYSTSFGSVEFVQWDRDGAYDAVLGPQNLDGFGSSSSPIPFRFRTGFFDMGDPSLMKLVSAIYIDMENPVAQVGVGAPWNDIVCNVYYDYDDTTVSPDSFTIPAAVNKISHLVCIPLNPGGLTPGTTSYGKECRSIALEFLSPSYPAKATGVWRRMTFHSVGFEFTPVQNLRQGGNMEYSNLGYDGDKKLYVLKLTYDTTLDDAAHQFALHLDTRT